VCFHCFVFLIAYFICCSTAAESERRTRQLEVLHSKAIQMQKMFEDQMSTKAQEDRNKLMGEAGMSSWGPSNETRTDVSNYSVDQLRSDQRKMLGGCFCFYKKGIDN
jgi:hypothetical protein